MSCKTDVRAEWEWYVGVVSAIMNINAKMEGRIGVSKEKKYLCEGVIFGSVLLVDAPDADGIARKAFRLPRERTLLQN